MISHFKFSEIPCRNYLISIFVFYTSELELRQHCQKFRVTSNTVDILCDRGIETLASLSVMTTEDIGSLGESVVLTCV